MRLIDADAAVGRYYAEWEKQDIHDGDQDRDWLKRCIDETPTIDAVPVVRCKDCKHFEYAHGCKFHAADENGTPIFVREDDFCSYGKRKDGDG